MKYILKILKRNLNPTKLIKNETGPRDLVRSFYLFKDQIAIKRRYSWGISPLPYYKTDQSTWNGTAGVSPPYLTVWRIYPSKKVQLGYLPLTLLHDGSVYAGGYSWGISPLPDCVTNVHNRCMLVTEYR